MSFFYRINFRGFLFADNSSFLVNGQYRRDATFFLCGEVSRFIHRLCFRCYTADTVPLESAWLSLLSFQTSEGTFQTEEDFLVRHQMTNKVGIAARQKAEGVHSGKRVDRSVIQKTASTIKSEFTQDVLKYIQYLIGAVLKQTGLSSYIIKGLAAFDPNLLLKRPTEVCLRHFDILYSTFRRRSWVLAANEPTSRDQYIALLDYLRANYSADFEVTDAAQDLIEFMMNLEFLQSQEHLSYLFKLCCLCITTVSTTYPAVKMGGISTSGHQGRFTDVILPGQSYLSNVPGSVHLCVDETNLIRFTQLSASFGQSAFSPTYDPWESVDQFGRSKIYKSLLSTYRTIQSESTGSSGQKISDEERSVVDEAALKVPSCSKRQKLARKSSRSRSSSVASTQSSSAAKQ